MGKRKCKGLSGVAHFLRAEAGSVPQDEEQARTLTPPQKKQKLGQLGDEWEKFDPSSLATQYTSEEQLPDHLQKYYAQRHRYFSLYDEGCLLDEEGWYSVTPEKIANQIAERCRCDTILDAFCGVGGNAIAFAKTCHRVIAIDNSPVRIAIARHNAIVYGVQDRIEFILADYLDFARAYLSRPAEQRIIDAVFLSPPWGGPSYLLDSPQKEKTEVDCLVQADYSLQSISPIPGDDLFRLTRRISHNIAFFLPRNVNLEEISRLTLPDLNETRSSNLVNTQRIVGELVEVEEEYMSGKLKAVTCYFGGLVTGQEDLF